MKRLCATLATLALTGGLAFAQSSGGTSSGGASTGGASTGGTAASPASPTSPTNPGSSPSPGANPPAPSDLGTTGRAPGVNPANPQDMTGRGNPQDLTRPRGVNPQDARPPASVPQIYVPERR